MSIVGGNIDHIWPGRLQFTANTWIRDLPSGVIVRPIRLQSQSFFIGRTS
jgi:hypothetical protein